MLSENVSMGEKRRREAVWTSSGDKQKINKKSIELKLGSRSRSSRVETF